MGLEIKRPPSLPFQRSLARTNLLRRQRDVHVEMIRGHAPDILFHPVLEPGKESAAPRQYDIRKEMRLSLRRTGFYAVDDRFGDAYLVNADVARMEQNFRNRKPLVVQPQNLLKKIFLTEYQPHYISFKIKRLMTPDDINQYKHFPILNSSIIYQARRA